MVSQQLFPIIDSYSSFPLAITLSLSKWIHKVTSAGQGTRVQLEKPVIIRFVKEIEIEKSLNQLLIPSM